MSNTHDAARIHQHQRMKEGSIQKTVIIGGSSLMIICFTLIIVTEIIDNPLHDTPEERIAFVISLFGLMVFSTILIAYAIYLVHRERTHIVDTEFSIENVSLL